MESRHGRKMRYMSTYLLKICPNLWMLKNRTKMVYSWFLTKLCCHDCGKVNILSLYVSIILIWTVIHGFGLFPFNILSVFVFPLLVHGEYFHESPLCNYFYTTFASWLLINTSNYQKPVWMRCACESLNGIMQIDFDWFTMMIRPLQAWIQGIGCPIFYI